MGSSLAGREKKEGESRQSLTNYGQNSACHMAGDALRCHPIDDMLLVLNDKGKLDSLSFNDLGRKSAGGAACVLRWKNECGSGHLGFGIDRRGCARIGFGSDHGDLVPTDDRPRSVRSVHSDNRPAFHLSYGYGIWCDSLPLIVATAR